MVICDRLYIRQGFSEGSSLKNHKFCGHRGSWVLIYERLGKGGSNKHKCGRKIRRRIISASAISNLQLSEVISMDRTVGGRSGEG